MKTPGAAVAEQRILLGMTGGIAAYKSADLVRRLRERGAEVQVVMTAGAREFVTPTTMQAVSHRPVRESLWDPGAEAAMGHIELARWATLVLVAPATANFMAKLAGGLADDLLTTLCLATESPVALAPAMNWAMWQHPATQTNKDTLEARGVRFLGPGEGALAEKESGIGRMLEPLEITELVLSPDIQPVLRGVRAVVTAGPTREPIDPVRYISNRSSGKMGYAVARALSAAGAKVTLVTGPVALQPPAGVDVQYVETAADMYDAVIHRLDQMDLFVGTAAVADYSPDKPAVTKIKKEQGSMELSLGRTRDILATVASAGRPIFTVGFAAETNDLETHARHKLKNKKLDMVAANWVGEGRGFDADMNALQIFWQGGSTEIPHDDKHAVAGKLVSLIAAHYRRSQNQ
ncbi:MAG TPA: bifunctional phosphopantothenoylcysteine decarboxylase/phosphopantothenate--cysteine ligase CoaBC [Gammaproteobacteria bacterium]